MVRAAISILGMSVALSSLAGATPTPEEKCQAAKLNALRKRTFCVEGERRNGVRVRMAYPPIRDGHHMHDGRDGK